MALTAVSQLNQTVRWELEVSERMDPVVTAEQPHC